MNDANLRIQFNRIVRELEQTNRLLTALLERQLPVHPTIEQLGLVPPCE